MGFGWFKKRKEMSDLKEFGKADQIDPNSDITIGELTCNSYRRWTPNDFSPGSDAESKAVWQGYISEVREVREAVRNTEQATHRHDIFSWSEQAKKIYEYTVEKNLVKEYPELNFFRDMDFAVELLIEINSRRGVPKTASAYNEYGLKIGRHHGIDDPKTIYWFYAAAELDPTRVEPLLNLWAVHMAIGLRFRKHEHTNHPLDPEWAEEKWFLPQANSYFEKAMVLDPGFVKTNFRRELDPRSPFNEYDLSCWIGPSDWKVTSFR